MCQGHRLIKYSQELKQSLSALTVVWIGKESEKRHLKKLAEVKWMSEGFMMEVVLEMRLSKNNLPMGSFGEETKTTEAYRQLSGKAN